MDNKPTKAFKDYIRIYDNANFCKGLAYFDYKKMFEAEIEREKSGQNSKTILVDTTNSLNSNLLDMMNICDNEFGKGINMKISSMKIRYSVNYKFSYPDCSKILQRLCDKIMYMNGGDIITYIPVGYVKQSRNENVYKAYTYFVLFIPFYNFAIHSFFLSTTTYFKELLAFGKSALYDIFDELGEELDVDIDLAKAIYDSHTKTEVKDTAVQDGTEDIVNYLYKYGIKSVDDLEKIFPRAFPGMAQRNAKVEYATEEEW